MSIPEYCSTVLGLIPNFRTKKTQLMGFLLQNFSLQVNNLLFEVKHSLMA